MKSIASWPQYTPEEIEAVGSVLRSGKVNYWTGEQCTLFENEFALYVGSKHAIAVSNGTVALEAALSALGIKSGDEVIVTSRTFLATVSAIVRSGAVPVFADVDYYSQNITADTIGRVLSKQTKAIICVHLAGWPCDMDPIIELAKTHGIKIVEDCAQAHGAFYKGQSVGSIGDVGCWSFCQDKIMSTGGEGGMITTSDSDLWQKMWSLKDHGKNYDKMSESHDQSHFRFVHDDFGGNYRMTEMQAAIGRIQLQKLDDWQRQRVRNMLQIWQAANDTKLGDCPTFHCQACEVNCIRNDGCKHGAYKAYVHLQDGKNMKTILLSNLKKAGVPVFYGSCSEVYLEKAFDTTSFRPKTRLPNAELLADATILFPCHPTLTESNLDHICSSIRDVFNKI